MDPGLDFPDMSQERGRLLLRVVPLLVLLVTLAGAIFVWHTLDAGARLKAQADYKVRTAAIAAHIVDRLQDQELLLLGGAGLFAAKGEVTRQDWRRYVAAHQLHRTLPGILGVGYTAWLTPAEKEAMVRKVRAEGFPQFQVQPAGERPRYTSIIYLEPFDWRNRRAFGYDMYSEAVRRRAMNMAVDGGVGATISGRITLVQETEHGVQSGVLMYLPVYEANVATDTREGRWAALKGFVYSPIRMDDFIRGTLGEFPDDIAFEIHDGAVRPENLLFRSHHSQESLTASGGALTSSTRLQVYGRTWNITFRSLPGFSPEFSRSHSVAVLAAGILLSILSAAATYNLLATRHKAVRMAQSMVKELRESEEKVGLILNSMAEAIYGIDTEGRCTFCNQSCLRLLGYQRPEQLLGKNMHDQIHHTTPHGTAFPAEDCRIFKAFRTGEEIHVDDEVLWRADGTSFFAEYWSYPQREGDRVLGAVVTFLDITDRKNLESELQRQTRMLEQEVAERRRAQEGLAEHAVKLEQWNQTLEKRVREEVVKNRVKDQKLIQQDKLASLGQLSAGVAHEINNPIAFVSSNLRVLNDYFDNLRRHQRLLESVVARQAAEEVRREVAASANSLDIENILADVESLIAESQDGALRIAKIVTDLKAFSRIDTLDFDSVDLTCCLESALSIAYNDLKYVAAIVKEYGELPPVLCHPGQMNQVFMNLLVNAGQAITPPGKIVLKTWCDAGFVYTAVSDTGHGIPPEIRRRIFEPFFTTKEVGKGTGLGLSISYDIIKKHGGEIAVESTVGSGTTFTVKLPRQSRPQPGGDQAQPVGGTGGCDAPVVSEEGEI
jgi:PAS domain S-box-containing protein